MASQNDEMVELHFEFEMSHQHASQEQIIIQSISEVMEIPKQDVTIDGVEAIKDNQQRLLLRGHIPTTKNVIEQLVKKLYNSLSTQKLHQLITKLSGLKDPFIEIRELYEADQNDIADEDTKESDVPSHKYPTPQPPDTDHEMVHLHFELEMSHQHASQDEIIIQSIAEVMELSEQDVSFDGVEAIEDNQQCLLFRGHISTPKDVIEQLVKKLYNAVSTQQLHQIVVKYSGLNDAMIEIRELFETDQNENEEEDTKESDIPDHEITYLHFELEIHKRLASEDQIMTQSIAEAMELPKEDVIFDGVQAYNIKSYNHYFKRIFRGYISTTKHVIVQLVEKFYNAISTKQLHQIVVKHLNLKYSNQVVVRFLGLGNPNIDIRELYEMDKNDHVNEDEDIDWTGGTNPTFLRKKLLQLSGPKLIEICKSRNVSSTGNKNDIVRRLVASSMYPTPKKVEQEKKSINENESNMQITSDTIFLRRNYSKLQEQGDDEKKISDNINLNIVELDVYSMKLHDLGTVNVSQSVINIQLARAIKSQLMKDESDNIKLEMAYHYIWSNKIDLFFDFDTLNSRARSYNEVRGLAPIRDNDTIYICGINGFLLPFLNENTDFIHLKYNTNIDIMNDMKNPPDFDAVEYDENIDVNLNMKLGDLRRMLQRKLNAEDIIIRKKYRGDTLKNDNFTLYQCFIHQTGHIWIDRGIGDKIKKNEYIFSLYIQNEFVQRKVLLHFIHEHIENKLNDKYSINTIIPASVIDLVFLYYYINTGDQPLIFVGDIALNIESDMETAKQMIYNKYKQYVPKASVMRIREFEKGTLTNIYFDDKLLGKNAKKYSKLYDYKPICCQRIVSIDGIDDEHTQITSKHLLLNIVRWYPSQLSFGPMLEMSFLIADIRSTTDKFFDQLALITTVAKNDLMVKYEGNKWPTELWGIKQCTNRYGGWYNAINAQVYAPNRHGYVIIYKDVREKQREFNWDDIATKEQLKELNFWDY